MKGLKKIFGYGVMLTLTMSLVGCGSSESEQSKLEEIKENGKLVVATSADYPPYEFHAEIDGKDTIVGFDIKIAEEIAKGLGVELELVEMKFDGLLMALDSGKSDLVISGMSPTPERQENVDFSEIYHTAQNVILTTNENKDKFNSEESLKNAKIAVQKSSLQESFVVDELGAENVTALSEIPSLILELENGNVDAVVLSSYAGTIHDENNDKIVISNSNVGDGLSEGSAIAFKKEDRNDDLVAEVNKILTELKEEDKISEFVEEATEIANNNK